MDSTFSDRFDTYFKRDVAQKAAKSLANGIEIQFEIQDPAGAAVESFLFTKANGKNEVRPGKARDPQMVFTMTPDAAAEILDDPTEELGAIGVNIARRVVRPDPGKKISFQFKAGFLSLFTKGYFGVLTAGGASFASFLASQGLNGIEGIKALLKKK